MAKNERVFTRQGHNFSCVNSLATLKQLDKNGKLAHIIVRQNSQRLYRAGSKIDEDFWCPFKIMQRSIFLQLFNYQKELITV